MDLSLRRTFIPYGVFNDGTQSVAYLDYLNAAYLDMLSDLDIEQTYRVEGQYAGCPELIAYKFYRSTDYWWILCRINEIIDPITDIVEGKLLRIPTITSIEQALTKALTVDSVGTTVEV